MTHTVFDLETGDRTVLPETCAVQSVDLWSPDGRYMLGWDLSQGDWRNGVWDMSGEPVFVPLTGPPPESMFPLLFLDEHRILWGDAVHDLRTGERTPLEID